MHGEHDSFLGADAVSDGVTTHEDFESSVVEIHGFGRRHQCEDSNCARCAKSTAGPALEGKLRAGDVRPDEGQAESERPRNNLKIAAGNITEIAEGLEEEDHDVCDSPDCRRCNTVVSDKDLRPGYTIFKGGGGSAGRKRAKNPQKVCQVVGCGMTLCEHVRGNPDSNAKRSGRPNKGGRSKPITYKISADAKAALKAGGVDGNLINELGMAVMQGLTVAQVRERLGLQKKHAA